MFALLSFLHICLLLVSGIADEKGYKHMHWGDTGSAEYKTLLEILRELGHLAKPITALKIDCEGKRVVAADVFFQTHTYSGLSLNVSTILQPLKLGCEWNLFAGMNKESLSHIGQILTEVHFTTTLRFNGDLAEKYSKSFVDNLDSYFDLFHFEKTDGAWYDRYIDERVAAAGIPTIARQEKVLQDGRKIVTNVAGCCIEMSLVNRHNEKSFPEIAERA